MPFFYTVILLFIIFQTSAKGNMIAVTLFAIHMNATPFTIGVLISLYSLFPIVFAIYAGRLADKIGYKIPILMGAFGMGVALFLPYSFPSISTLYISQTLAGISQIFLHITIQTLTGAVSKGKERRSRNFGTLSLAGSIGTFAGPLIIGFTIEIFDYGISYLLLSLMAFLTGICFLFLKIPKNSLRNEVIPNKNKKGLWKLLGKASLRRVIITSALILTGIGLFNFYFPIYGNEIGLSESSIGMVISIHALAFIVVRTIIPLIIKKYEEQSILIVCLVLSVIGFLILPLTSDVFILCFISFLIGLGLGAGQPISIVMTYDRTPKQQKGEVLGLRLSTNKLALFLVPLVFGAIGNLASYLIIFWITAAILLSGVFLIFDKGRKADEVIRKNERMHYK